MPNPSNAAGLAALQLESLEAREVPAILIQVDYTYDNGFFSANPEARATMERAATELGNTLDGGLAAIAPVGGNTWGATFVNPSTGATQSLSNPSVGADTVRLFVGARPLGGGQVGYGATTGFSATGTTGWIGTVETRGRTGFAPWGGSIAFDATRPWYFGESAAGLGSQQLDFYSVAVHELGHVLGIGTSPQWRSLSQGGTFRGPNTMAVHGGPVALTADGLHWADDGHGHNGASLDASLPYGVRVGWSALDAAALRDIGWSGGGSAAPSAAAGGATLFAVAGANGVFTQYAFRDGAATATGKQFLPFPGLAGALHQAHGDFDGDGAMDTIIATAGGGLAGMAVVSGVDGRVIGTPRLAHGAIAGVLAADLDGDGRPELISGEITPRGMAIYVYTVGGGAISAYGAVTAYGEPGRAAMYAATDDIDRSGYGDAISPAPTSHTDEAHDYHESDHDHDHGDHEESAADDLDLVAADHDHDSPGDVFGGLWVG